MSPKTKSKSKPDSALADVPFEQAFKELEKIVAQLEEGKLSLDESLALFERGQALAAHCGALLGAAELKIRKLLPQGELTDFAGEGEE
jgi:exodeoxyribonuclease VII small subunit